MSYIWTIFLNIVNAIGFIYNLPQMYRVWKTKSTKDIDTTGQVLRLFCSIVWIVYCIEYQLIDIGVSWATTFIGALWILVFKLVYEYKCFTKHPSETHVELMEMEEGGVSDDSSGLKHIP